MLKNLKIENLNVTLKNAKESNHIIKNLSLEIKEGELASLLGPSGCGKTTLLRTLAGLETHQSGTCSIGEKNIFQLPAHKRNIGLVFQDYALFPHLTVKENILIGLSRNDYSQDLYQKLIQMVKIDSLESRYPHQISGGQQQRVAIVRSLVRAPDLILLDEPFSGLDAHLREEMSNELRSLFKDLNISAILVTHDQKEAFSFSDKIGVMMNGELKQWSTPFDLYHEPKLRAVAEFIGETSFINIQKDASGKLQSAFEHFSIQNTFLSEGFLMVRPDDIVLLNDEETKIECIPAGTVILKATLVHSEFRGPTSLHTIKLKSGELIKALSPSHQHFSLNKEINFYVSMDRQIIFP